MLMTPQTRSVPIWAVFIYPPSPSPELYNSHPGARAECYKDNEPAEIFTHFATESLGHKCYCISHSLGDQKILTTESHSHCCWTTALSVTPGYEVTQCSNVLSDFLCVLIVVQINIQVLWELKARATITTALVMAEFNKGRLSQYLPKFSLSRNMSGNAIKRHLLLSLWLIVVVTTPYPMIHHDENGWWWEVSDIEYETLCLENTNRGNNSKKVSVCTL